MFTCNLLNFFFSCCLVKQVRLLSYIGYSCCLADGRFLSNLQTVSQKRKQKIIVIFVIVYLNAYSKIRTKIQISYAISHTNVSWKACKHDRKMENMWHVQGHKRKKKSIISSGFQAKFNKFSPPVTNETKTDSNAPKFR